MRMLQIYSALFLFFLLGSHEGFVALWLTPGGEPDKIFPYSVSSLPEADRQRLAEGIRIHSERELAQLLEDYLS